jgi:hypothetical protein
MHAMQVVAPDSSWYWPVAQSEHVGLPVEPVYLPGTQVAHCSKDLAPRPMLAPQSAAEHGVGSSFIHLPAGQSVQEAEPSSENLPLAQYTHSAAAEAPAVSDPAGHWTHTVAEAGLHVPAGQVEHTVEPSCE